MNSNSKSSHKKQKNDAGLRLCGQKMERLTVESIEDVHNARKEDLGVVKNVTRHYTINQKREQKGDTPEERASMTLSVEDPADENKVIWAKSVRLYLTRLSEACDPCPYCSTRPEGVPKGCVRGPGGRCGGPPQGVGTGGPRIPDDPAVVVVGVWVGDGRGNTVPGAAVCRRQHQG